MQQLIKERYLRNNNKQKRLQDDLKVVGERV